VNAAIDTATDPDFMQSLARGLEVLRLFEARDSLSMAEAASLTGLSRAVVRRCLHTLTVLGYVFADAERRFHPTPAMLALAQAYLAGNHLVKTAGPVLKRISDQMGESCSLGVRDGGEVVYVARAEVRRFISIDLQVGSRLPCYCTSMGRVLLAAMPDAELDAYLATAKLTPRTGRTIVDRQVLRGVLDQVRGQAYATIDEELEIGLRSLAVPVRNEAGQVVAALNLGTARERSIDNLLSEALPVLRAAAAELQARAG
jgi:IclR family pca regulon transcriptional regulator